MVNLEELGRVLGGTIRFTHDQSWLDTSIGGLGAAVICRRDARFDVAVITPAARELDPLHPHGEEWRLQGAAFVVPRLRHGYLFTGCRAGVLFATSWAPPEVEHVVGAMWELAQLARETWTPVDPADAARAARDHQADHRRQRLGRVLFVAGAIVIASLIRRAR
jgi:hypothetical protein